MLDSFVPEPLTNGFGLMGFEMRSEYNIVFFTQVDHPIYIGQAFLFVDEDGGLADQFSMFLFIFNIGNILESIRLLRLRNQKINF